MDSSTRFSALSEPDRPPDTARDAGGTRGPPRTYNFLDNRFVFGPQASARRPRFLRDLQDIAERRYRASKYETNQGSCGIREKVTAGYGMATMDIGPLTLIGGARLEHTAQTTTGNTVRRAGQAVTITPVSISRSYANVLPSLTGKYAVDEQTLVRAAITRSLVRPDFNQMAPTVNIPDGNNVVATIGNPELDPSRPPTSMSWWSVTSAPWVRVRGLFPQEPDRLHLPGAAPRAASDNLGSTVQSVSQPQNSEKGTLDGFEIAWQQNFPWLPGPLSGLGLNANYTKTMSSTTLPTREGIKARLPGQAGNSANAGVFYEKARVAVRLGYNFADRYLEVVGDDASSDIYVASRMQLDLSGSVKINAQTKLFVETNNLTNQPLRRYIGKPERSWQPGNEYYKPWGMVGLRIQP